MDYSYTYIDIIVFVIVIGLQCEIFENTLFLPDKKNLLLRIKNTRSVLEKT